MSTDIELTPTTRGTIQKKKSEIARAKSKIEDINLDDPVKMVIYGRNKTGKTVFACSSNLKTLVIDCNERGTKSVRHRGPHIKRYRVNRWEDLDAIYWYLRAGDHDFEVIVIDTITMLATVCMRWVLKDDADRDFTRDPLTPDKRSWGKLGEALKDAIIKFRNLPCHIIFTAQEKSTTTEEDDGTITNEVHPELSPSPRSTLLSAVDLIGRLYVREAELKNGKTTMERRMLLGAHPKYVAGNRFEELKYIERNPNLQEFFDRIGVKSNA